MSVTLNRRTFLGASLLTAATPLQAAASWVEWLATPAAVERIYGILHQHLGLTAGDAPLVPEFIKRLKTKGLHTETPETFVKYLTDPAEAKELEAYVVEEFIVASNYFAVRLGEETHYRILEV